jgi:GrpB-like predicted nucleotidyltransferase (UPF0157 family)
VVTIVPYKPSWPGEFQQIAQVLRHALGDLALRIDHIGSTSVRGLAAKDRIDIQVTVASLDAPVEDALNQVGYQRIEYLTDHPPSGVEAKPGDWSKWVFKPPVDQRPTNLHVRVVGRPNQRYALLFRDYLRTHSAAAEAYAELKRRLADNLADPDTYPDVKDPAVDLIYLAAEDWAAAPGWHPGLSDA